MVKLEKPIFVNTILFLQNLVNSGGAKFFVGYESDPSKFGDNRECPERVGPYDVPGGQADSGYFICGLWGNVIVVVQEFNYDYYLQIMEFRVFSWDHLSSLADPSKVKTSCGPGHCIDLVDRSNFVQSPESLLRRRKIAVALK